MMRHQFGFVLNGVRNWDGKLTAYDTGTGVIETYRKQGITSNMLLNVRQLFKEMGVEQYLLEVIQSNTSALQLYKKQGFKILRELECFHLDKNKYNPITTYKVEHVNMINSNEWRELTEFWDFVPSWQILLIPLTLYQMHSYILLYGWMIILLATELLIRKQEIFHK